MLTNYYLNRRWTFRSTGAVARELPKFFTVSVIAYLVNLGIFTLALQGLHLSDNLSQVIAIACVMPDQLRAEQALELPRRVSSDAPAGPLRAELDGGGRHPVNLAAMVVTVTAGFLTLLVLGACCSPTSGTGCTTSPTSRCTADYAARIAAGERPSRTPSRSNTRRSPSPLFRVPGHAGSESLLRHWFNILMGAITIAHGGGHGRTSPAGSGPEAGEPTWPRSSSR